MKYPVSAAAQYEFVSNAKNWEYLQDVEDLDTEEGFYLIGLLFVAMLLLYRWLVLEEGTDRAKIQ